jgi:alpha-galactosidase
VVLGVSRTHASAAAHLRLFAFICGWIESLRTSDGYGPIYVESIHFLNMKNVFFIEQSVRCACIIAISAFVAGFCGTVSGSETVSLSSLDLSGTEQDWGSPQKDKSVDGHPLSIGGKKFDTGLGTHATSSLRINLNGKGDKFTAWVGVDDEEKGQPSSITFSVDGDGKTLWESGVMHSGDAPKQVNVDVRGVKALHLLVGDAGDGINCDHADWADASFVMLEGRPDTASAAPPEAAVILTPQPGPEPAIHGPDVYGCRLVRPFLYQIPATGTRPMTFSARGLPRGIAVDGQTWLITG